MTREVLVGKDSPVGSPGIFSVWPWIFSQLQGRKEDGIRHQCQQNYVRAETLIRANARLVDAQAKIPLAQAWGGGEVASADGLRFVVPVRTVNAGPNSKYFGTGRGITYYNFTSDQFTGFHGIVSPARSATRCSSWKACWNSRPACIPWR